MCQSQLLNSIAIIVCLTVCSNVEDGSLFDIKTNNEYPGLRLTYNL
jgi:hypothetical protein